MLCLEDCMDFSDLNAEEIEAISEHEHIPLICAAELGCELLKTRSGTRKLYDMMQDDIELAIAHGRPEAAAHWEEVL